MVEANIKIIEELKYFLKLVSTDAEFRELVTNGKHHFTRNRKLPLERVVGIVLNMPKRSLSAEIHDFFECLEACGDKCTKGAFSLQRGKLNPLFFEAWNKWLVNNFYHYYGDNIKRWKGFLLQAADSSAAYLFNTKEVIGHFGCHTNQHGGNTPIARVMQIHDILNDITVWGGIYPFKKSERAIMAEQIPNLAKDSVTLFDRGFPGYGLIYMMLNEEAPRHFVMRCKVDLNKQTKEFARNKKKSIIIELTPGYKSITMLRKQGYIVTNKTTIKVRMVKFMLSSGEMEILITDLFDEQQYSVEDLKYLYGLRWGIETSYGKQKNQLQMEQFSGHRVVCIKQDYAATIFASNMQRIVEKQCDDYVNRINSRRKLTYQINRNISLASLKNNIVKLFLLERSKETLIYLQRRFEQHLEPIRPNRHPPRIRKSKKLLGKYQTFTNYRRAL
jgi:hypothetical protein